MFSFVEMQIGATSLFHLHFQHIVKITKNKTNLIG